MRKYTCIFYILLILQTFRIFIRSFRENKHHGVDFQLLYLSDHRNFRGKFHDLDLRTVETWNT